MWSAIRRDVQSIGGQQIGFASVKGLLLMALPLTCVAGLIGFRFWRFNFDDAIISYRIAENIAKGQGWVYNSGERINGPRPQPLPDTVLA